MCAGHRNYVSIDIPVDYNWYTTLAPKTKIMATPLSYCTDKGGLVIFSFFNNWQKDAQKPQILICCFQVENNPPHVYHLWGNRCQCNCQAISNIDMVGIIVGAKLDYRPRLKLRHSRRMRKNEKQSHYHTLHLSAINTYCMMQTCLDDTSCNPECLL